MARIELTKEDREAVSHIRIQPFSKFVMDHELYRAGIVAGIERAAEVMDDRGMYVFATAIRALLTEPAKEG